MLQQSGNDNMHTHVNPFEGMNVEEVYAGLVAGRFGPRWPDGNIQAGYTGTNRFDTLRRAFAFVDVLARDGAFKPGWKGLDYGCGWGRFASVLLSQGAPDQLDLCDAWPHTLRIIAELGYENEIFRVSELLKPGEIREGYYDLVLSFSVFTHLSSMAFEQNIPLIRAALKSGGTFYFTVRHHEFIEHKYADRAKELERALADNGYVHVETGGDMSAQKVFGDMIVTSEYLQRFGPVRYLGLPSYPLQHVYALDCA